MSAVITLLPKSGAPRRSPSGCNRTSKPEGELSRLTNPKVKGIRGEREQGCRPTLQPRAMSPRVPGSRAGSRESGQHHAIRPNENKLGDAQNVNRFYRQTGSNRFGPAPLLVQNLQNPAPCRINDVSFLIFRCHHAARPFRCWHERLKTEFSVVANFHHSQSPGD